MVLNRTLLMSPSTRCALHTSSSFCFWARSAGDFDIRRSWGKHGAIAGVVCIVDMQPVVETPNDDVHVAHPVSHATCVVLVMLPFRFLLLFFMIIAVIDFARASSEYLTVHRSLAHTDKDPDSDHDHIESTDLHNLDCTMSPLESLIARFGESPL